MKKRILLLTAVLGLGYMTLSSYSDGPAFNSGQNRTGAKGSLTTCGGPGCHGTGTGPTVTITVDSGTTAVTHYKPGMSYTIKLHGAGTTNTKFGFQFAAVSGSGSSQISAGSYGSLPVALHSSTASSLTIVEQSNTLTGTAGLYDESFSWTAPSSAVGNITLYCTINSVNGDGNENAADVSGNTSFTLTPTASTTAIASRATADLGVKIFPNPAVGDMNIQLNDAGAYNVRVFNLNGKVIATRKVTEGDNAISTSGWATGTYMVSVEKDGVRQVIPVTKQ